MAQAKLVSIASRARFTDALTRPSTAPVGWPVAVAFGKFIAALAGHPCAYRKIRFGSIGGEVHR
jgi:hypothetical protein